MECIGFEIPRVRYANFLHAAMLSRKSFVSLSQDTFHEEMYSLDNDSFLNSLEAMTTVTWPDYGSGVSTDSSTCTRSNDSDV